MQMLIRAVGQKRLTSNAFTVGLFSESMNAISETRERLIDGDSFLQPIPSRIRA